MHISDGKLPCTSRIWLKIHHKKITVHVNRSNAKEYPKKQQ